MITLLSGVVVLLTLSACGRSDPSGAAAVDPGDEPGIAGIEVVSDEPVVDPTATAVSVSTTTATTQTVPAATSDYVVQPGDTLSVIAERFGVSVAELSAANNISDVDTIRPGQELLIPGG